VLARATSAFAFATVSRGRVPVRVPDLDAEETGPAAGRLCSFEPTEQPCFGPRLIQPEKLVAEAVVPSRAELT